MCHILTHWIIHRLVSFGDFCPKEAACENEQTVVPQADACECIVRHTGIVPVECPVDAVGIGATVVPHWN